MKFMETKLWKQAFECDSDNSDANVINFLESQFLEMRDRVSKLVSLIRVDMPDLTIHDISHLDSLWEMASLFVDEEFNLNPTEVFVFGASVLLHDAGLCVAAYDNDLEKLKKMPEFKDYLVYEAKSSGNFDKSIDFENPPEELVNKVIPKILRQNHPDLAYKLAVDGLLTKDGEREFLIPNPAIREAYGLAIGLIAQSHGYSVDVLEEKFPTKLGSQVIMDSNLEVSTEAIDGLKIAILLRLSDAIHVDNRRAPPFLHSLLCLDPNSEIHWKFQEKMLKPLLERDSLVFTTGSPFKKNESKSWWLAHDTLVAIDKEIKEVNSLLKEKYDILLNASYVKGISSTGELTKYIKTEDWHPIDVKLHISDIESLVKRFGGRELYGNDLTIPIRELIQNARDAIIARQKIENTNDWDRITVGLSLEGKELILFVEDNGVGMSEKVLTGALLDFGNSFWGTLDSIEEFPTLMSSGMDTIAKYGIGFYSVFMLSAKVRIYTRNYKLARDKGLLLEFEDGMNSKPILSNCDSQKIPAVGGTRVELVLDCNSDGNWEFLNNISLSEPPASLARLVCSIVPCLDVSIDVNEFGKVINLTSPADWVDLSAEEFFMRICPLMVNDDELYDTFDFTPWFSERGFDSSGFKCFERLLQPIVDRNNKIYGRAFIMVADYIDEFSYLLNGILVSHGVLVENLYNVAGIMFGEVDRLDRKSASICIPEEVLANWASNQAKLIAENIDIDEYQAKSAEIVLHLGGDISYLNIIEINNVWYNKEEFFEYLLKIKTLKLITNEMAQFNYMEDSTTIKEFVSTFELNSDIAMIYYHDAEILPSNRNNTTIFKRTINEYSEFKLLFEVKNIIKSAWNNDFREIEELDCVIGLVKNVSIKRNILIFERN